MRKFLVIQVFESLNPSSHAHEASNPSRTPDEIHSFAVIIPKKLIPYLYSSRESHTPWSIDLDPAAVPAKSSPQVPKRHVYHQHAFSNYSAVPKSESSFLTNPFRPQNRFFTENPFSLQVRPSRRVVEVPKSPTLTRNFFVPLPCLPLKVVGA